MQPCHESFEPVLKKHRIDRQAYHSGAFMGNHIHKALQPATCKEITSAPLQTMTNIFNTDNSPYIQYTPQQQDLPDRASALLDKYSRLFTQYKDCRAIFAVCNKITPDKLHQLSTNIKLFMATLRKTVYDQNKTITPKMHMLEAHTVDCISQFGVSLGLMGEQGGESIHKCFKHLRTSISNQGRGPAPGTSTLLAIFEQHAAKIQRHEAPACKAEALRQVS